MLNHFRTLLLNKPSATPSEHIPVEFSSKVLPSDLKKIYDKLFVPNSTNFYRFFLVQNYLNIISGAGLQDYVTAFDNRISYDLNDQSYFLVNRASNPIISDPEYPIQILSNLSSVAYSDYHYDAFTIAQVSNSNNVTVYSKTKGKYLKNNGEFDSPSDSACWIPVPFPNGFNTSSPIFIGHTGVSFAITNLSGEAFTTTSNKFWEFLIESPYTFDVLFVVRQLIEMDVFKIFKQYTDVSELERMYIAETNTIYKFAVILIAYVTVINSL